MGYQIENTEYTKAYKKETWDVAIGLQAVDNLVPSTQLKELSTKEVDGELTITEVEDHLKIKYRKETEEEKRLRTREADIVSSRIAKIQREVGFMCNPTTLQQIHKELFMDIYDEAGMIRNYNFTKAELILSGKSVTYERHQNILASLSYYCTEECFKDYSHLSTEEKVQSLMYFTANIWKIHGFCEGNTRTTAVFIQKHLNAKGFAVDNTLFAQRAKYFRNALVRATYENQQIGIAPDFTYLRKFFGNLLLKEHNMLSNHDFDIQLKKQEEAIDVYQLFNQPDSTIQAIAQQITTKQQQDYNNSYEY